ncbi:MAG: hypothetical protein OCD03_13105 [Hyphomicrobiales bacterium]
MTRHVKIKFHHYRSEVDAPKWSTIVNENGIFHQFGLDVEEDANGFSSFSTAIVEMSNGVVHNVAVHNIQFLDAPL